jgi:hypothetical protein
MIKNIIEIKKKMNKFIIEESEVKRILSMHKSLIKEQSPTTAADVSKSIKDQLTVFTTNGCVENGKVVPMKTTNPQKSYAIRQESRKTPGKVRYLFIDNTVGISDDTGKFTFLPNKWACNTGAIQNKSSAEQAAATAATASKENLERTKKSGNWKERNEISDTNANLENPKMYEKTVVDGVTLYRDVISSGVAEGLTPEQIKVIKKYTDLGYKLRKDLDAEEAQTWSKEVVYPAGTLFSQDLVMFFPPSNVRGAEGTVIQKAFNDAVSNQRPESIKDCKDTIRAYYDAWKTKKRVEPNTFLPMKEKVQACVDNFGGNWGIPALTKIDDYVEILTGGIGGPSKMGDDAKWRLKK